MIRTEASRHTSGRSLGLWLILALALALRVWKIADKNLWLDESTSWALATGSLKSLIAWTAADIHPPLYYLLLKGWILIAGDSLAGLRSLSVVSSLVALYLLFQLAAGSVTRGVAYAVAVWFAVSPHAIYYSQEARMYAPVTAVVLGACLAYRRWVESAFTSGFAILAYVACATVALYLHYFTALVFAAIWLHVIVLAIGRRGWTAMTETAPPPRWTAWLVAHVAIGACYLPWIGTAMAQITRGQVWRQPVAIGQIPDHALELVRMLTFGVYHVPFFRTVPGAVATSVLAVGLGRLILGVGTIRRTRDERDLFLLLVAVTPVMLGLAMLPTTGHMDLSRYLPYAAPLAVLAAARGLSLVSVSPVAAIAALLAGTAAMVPSLRGYYADHVKDSDMRPIVAYLRANAQHEPGQDSILIAPGYMITEARFISRDALSYEEVDTDAGLWSAVAAHAPDARPPWLVVDYRWSGFHDLERDARVKEVEVPGGTPAMNRLFRVVNR
jgi:hypothetical protein